MTTTAAAERIRATECADAILLKALSGALNRGLFRPNVRVDKNLVDAFTARLIDAGVDMHELDLILADGDPDLIDRPDEDETPSPTDAR